MGGSAGHPGHDHVKHVEFKSKSDVVDDVYPKDTDPTSPDKATVPDNPNDRAPSTRNT